MSKKRKANASATRRIEPPTSKYDIEERFDDSEDDFYAGKDKILLDSGPAVKRQRRMEEQEKGLQPSDEEVLRYSSTDDDNFDEQQFTEEGSEDGSEEDNGEVWGTTKADYYNADAIETEADALDEEKEARRLQQKQLKTMTIADFGFEELTWTQPERKVISGPVVEKLPEARISAHASEGEVVNVLYNRYPEFHLLARDLVELQDAWCRLHEQAATVGSAGNGVTIHTKLNALTSYLGAIAMYFAVISSSVDSKADASMITALAPNSIREHAVIDNLRTTRQLWDSVRNLQEMEILKEPMPSATKISKLTQLARNPKANSEKLEKKKTRRSSSDFGELDEVPSPLEKTEKSPRVLDLQMLLARSAAPKLEEGSDFGDEEPLTEQQAAEKARKKKSLRFYTSQIAQKANKRGAASRGAGGDDDVPHKERLRDKQERLLREAEKRGKQQATGDEVLGGESDNEMQDVEGGGYYESLVTNSKRKKAEKQAKAETYAEAARQGAQVYEEEQVGLDGKRRITYAIEKNKGLAPKRNKDVRNPRVKKRKKYEEKMKKLGSVRQVYKGGEGRGGYGGELTGIKTNIVKSTKL